MNNLNNSKNLNDNFFDSSSEFLIIEDGTLKRVDAEIVNVPFRESVNPNKREVEAAKGLDFAE